jgi:SAM-dependent methyltransferase
METVKCNLCGSDDYRLVYSMPDARYSEDEWFHVVECTRCGLGFVNPRPTRSEMSRYYPSRFYEYFDAERHDHHSRYAAEAKFLLDVASGNPLLLDLGCANGDFPRFMQGIGWGVEGVEVSSHSKPITDFKVYQEEFHKIPVEKPRYDAITAWAVLEHVHDPMAYFKKAGRVLKKEGMFIFLVTNFKSLSSRCLYLEDVPRHLYFFTEETVKKYLKEAGFVLIRKDCSNRVYSMHPVNWLRYFVYRFSKKREMEWRDIQFAAEYQTDKSRGEWDRWTKRLIFFGSHPLYAIDRLLMPLYERYQILAGKYGIVTYIAKRG